MRLTRNLLPIALTLSAAGYLLLGACGIIREPMPPLSRPDVRILPPGSPYQSDFVLHATYRLQQPVLGTRWELQLAAHLLSPISLIPRDGNPSHGDPPPSMARSPSYLAASIPAGTLLKLSEMRVIHNFGTPEVHPLMMIKDPQFSDLGLVDCYPLSTVPPTCELPSRYVSPKVPRASRTPEPPTVRIDPHFLILVPD